MTELKEFENIPDDVRNRDVESDDGLTTNEKEIRIVGSNRDDYLRVSSEIPTFIKWVLSITESDIEWVRLSDSGAIIAICALVPKGNVKLQGSSRKAQTNSQMVAYGNERSVD